MGAAAVPLAIGGSIASMAFKGASSEAEGVAAQSQYQAKAAGDTFEAARAERAAEIGRVQADQTDGQLREQLRTTLSNINAVRASSGVSSDSPTGMAITDRETKVADRELRNKTFSIRSQADEDTRSAAYKRSTAEYALGMGRFARSAAHVKTAGILAGGIANLGRSYGKGA